MFNDLEDVLLDKNYSLLDDWLRIWFEKETEKVALKDKNKTIKLFNLTVIIIYGPFWIKFFLIL